MGNAQGVATWTASGGDVSGSYNALTLDKIQGKTVSMPTTIATGQVLKWSGSTWAPGIDADTKPTTSSVESGVELVWSGSAFESRSMIYLRGYISAQQTFVPGNFDIGTTAEKVKYVQHFSSDNGSYLNSAGEFIVPRTAYYFISATVAVVSDPTDVTLAVFKSTDSGFSWSMEINGNATPVRTPTTAVMVTGIVYAETGTRLVVGLRNVTTITCKSGAYADTPLQAQNIVTIMELP
ncbi:hypothetical protein JW992_13890 [candidate division KSB1 bacterium]|nr:hypothetical protein [candidate division KSB1 bacterium]